MFVKSPPNAFNLRWTKAHRATKKQEAWSSAWQVYGYGTGRFPCLQIAYRLDTPPGVHNVLHAWLLPPAAADPFPSVDVSNWEPPAVLTYDEDGETVEE